MTLTILEWSRRINRGQSARVLFTLMSAFPVVSLQARLDGLLLPPPASIDTAVTDLRDVAGLYVLPPAVPATYNLTITARTADGCEAISKPLAIQVR